MAQDFVTHRVTFIPPENDPLFPSLIITATGAVSLHSFKQLLQEVKLLEVQRYFSEEFEDEWVESEVDPFTEHLQALGFTAIEVISIPATFIHGEELVA